MDWMMRDYPQLYDDLKLKFKEELIEKFMPASDGQPKKTIESCTRELTRVT